MNKRTKSERLIYRNENETYKNIRTKGKHNGLQNQSIHQELTDLKSKVEQSKPILTTIYEKVKQKEENYQHQIKEKEKSYQQARILTKQYRQLHQQSLRILQKNDSLNRFTGDSNYQSLKKHQISLQANHQQNERSIRNINYQSLKHLPIDKKDGQDMVKNIIKEYNSNKIDENNKAESQLCNGRSVYERYKNKIQSQRQENKENRETTLNKVRKLSKQIQKDLQQLKLNKNKSLNLLTATGKATLKIQTHPKKNKKQYFLQLQKRKLKNL